MGAASSESGPQGIDCAELKRSLRQVVDALLRAVAIEGHSDYVYGTDATQGYVVGADGTIRIGHIPPSGPDGLTTRGEEFVCSLPAAARVHAILAEAGPGQRCPHECHGGGLPPTGVGNDSSTGLIEFVERCLRASPDLAMPETAFDEACADLEAHHTSSSVHFRYVSPIANLGIEGDEIDLGGGVRVVRLSACEVQQIVGPLWDANYSELKSLQALLESRLAVVVDLLWDNKREPPLACTPPQEASRVIECMRLLKRGSPFCNLTYTRIVGFHPYFATGCCHAGDIYPAWVRFKPEMVLATTEVDALRALWSALADVHAKPGAGGLEVALRRFDEAHGNRRPEDVVLDLCILLESALLRDGRGQLGYRLAVRGARLLAPHRDPHSTFRVLQLLYDLRGAIVHRGRTVQDALTDGGRLARKASECLAHQPEDRGFVALCVSLCRDLLRGLVPCVAGGESLSGILADVDACIVGGRPAGSATSVPGAQ